VITLNVICQRCGYSWKARADRELPNNCANPRCKSNFWDTPRKYKQKPKDKPPSGVGTEDGLSGE